MEQWDIKKSEGTCAATGKIFEPGEEYVAALVDNGNEFTRLDYALEYWQQNQPQVFSYWKTRAPLPDQKKKLFVDNDVLINLFHRLDEENDDLKINFRFVLMLILMRKRLLKYEQSFIQEGKEIWAVKFPRDDKVHHVINPHLDDQQIEEVSQELSSVLQGQL